MKTFIKTAIVGGLAASEFYKQNNEAKNNVRGLTKPSNLRSSENSINYLLQESGKTQYNLQDWVDAERSELRRKLPIIQLPTAKPVAAPASSRVPSLAPVANVVLTDVPSNQPVVQSNPPVVAPSQQPIAPSNQPIGSSQPVQPSMQPIAPSNQPIGSSQPVQPSITPSSLPTSIEERNQTKVPSQAPTPEVSNNSTNPGLASSSSASGLGVSNEAIGGAAAGGAALVGGIVYAATRSKKESAEKIASMLIGRLTKQGVEHFVETLNKAENRSSVGDNDNFLNQSNQEEDMVEINFHNSDTTKNYDNGFNELVEEAFTPDAPLKNLKNLLGDSSFNRLKKFFETNGQSHKINNLETAFPSLTGIRANTYKRTGLLSRNEVDSELKTNLIKALKGERTAAANIGIQMPVNDNLNLDASTRGEIANDNTIHDFGNESRVMSRVRRMAGGLQVSQLENNSSAKNTRMPGDLNEDFSRSRAYSSGEEKVSNATSPNTIIRSTSFRGVDSSSKTFEI